MTTTRPRGGRFVGAVVLAAGLAGCTVQEFRRIPVGGNATLDGQPFTGGILTFLPDTEKGNNYRASCQGPVKDGKFNLTTLAVRSTDAGPGTPPGWYKVYLYTEHSGQDLKIHPRFLDPKKTPISVEVVDNPAPGAYDIVFTSK